MVPVQPQGHPCSVYSLLYSQGKVATKDSAHLALTPKLGTHVPLSNSCVTLAKSHQYSAGCSWQTMHLRSVKQSFRKEKQKRLSGGINTPGLIAVWLQDPGAVLTAQDGFNSRDQRRTYPNAHPAAEFRQPPHHRKLSSKSP